MDRPHAIEKPAEPTARTQLPAAFFKLSAELRNRIYEEVLLHQDPIKISDSLAEPSLLAVNRQIRHEAAGIYYTQNTFSIGIYALDATARGAFHRLVQAKGLVASQISIRTLCYGRPRWGNLVRWAREVYEGRNRALMVGDATGSEVDKVVVAVTGFVSAYRGTLEWEECVRVLGVLRLVAGYRDGDWLKSEEDWRRDEEGSDVCCWAPFD